MDSLLNNKRPPFFCPGCSHDLVLRSVDRAFQHMGLAQNQIAMISDIGCSGLFDTYFSTHAFHGLHGRALTYATGLKLVQPNLNVVVTMGDGGMGIGGAHFLAACRKNLNLTLLVLNNFNFGMTGGQFSATTPPDAIVGSGFLNKIEKPMDVASMARTAGATFVNRASANQKDLPHLIEAALRFEGFSVIDIWGICPGRYLKRNKLKPTMIQYALDKLPEMNGFVPENGRPEYREAYLSHTQDMKSPELPEQIETSFAAPSKKRQEIAILGQAGQRIQTAAKVLGLAGIHGGLQSTQKSEFNTTVLRGPSISEVILSSERIGYTGITKPAVTIALSEEGVERRKGYFSAMREKSFVIQVAGVSIPATRAQIVELNFKDMGIGKPDWAVASLIALAKLNRVLSIEMLMAGLESTFKDRTTLLGTMKELIEKVKI